ncbi:MAG: tRNA lysidine(34) synthetase TilS [Candidatus Omnitrophota bacterium]|nr:tRNA lysidine(34) synthetase TilS [Candidatus Omnitrophota bacterium]MBU1928400.1 tRNA lysidine(34) synthetase TilS [Candidatus Omnitrophota bacterium]MBU2034731.1 tRNA lysidine(34) synthetase TilS [Candidatus Omnitrophota bacterium]MBU2258266.1 tRNA lysidine(34) synthetase TilS [Candidatus Omnitrophota bacterium]
MLIDKVKTTIKKYGLFCKGDTVVIGVSGGPDSVTLLWVINTMKKDFNLKLHVVHVDHKLRPDSGKDREFVVKLTKKMKIPMTVETIHIKKLSLKGSLEEIARNARLGALFQVAKKIKADKIALGHNLDDQAETLLMRILRGSGLYGLSGILPKRKFAGFIVIRPLIEIKRREIEMFLKKRGIKARIDKTNSEDIFFRNKIRNCLIPLLEKEYSGNLKEILSNMAENIGYDYDYLLKISNKHLSRSGNMVNIEKFIRLHPSIRRLVLRSIISRVKGDTRSITFRHIRELEDLIINRPINSIVDLPKNVSAVKKKKSLVFYRRNTQ